MTSIYIYIYDMLWLRCGVVYGVKCMPMRGAYHFYLEKPNNWIEGPGCKHQQKKIMCQFLVGLIREIALAILDKEHHNSHQEENASEKEPKILEKSGSGIGGKPTSDNHAHIHSVQQHNGQCCHAGMDIEDIHIDVLQQPHMHIYVHQQMHAHICIQMRMKLHKEYCSGKLTYSASITVVSGSICVRSVRLNRRSGVVKTHSTYCISETELTLLPTIFSSSEKRCDLLS